MKGKSKDIHILISVILFVVMRIILGRCTDMGITPAGASALSLFISTIYLWITYGSGWTSLISIALLAFTGICPAGTVLANSFGNSTTVICIGTLALSVALEETGVTTRISNWFITRKFVNNRPYMFMLMFFLAEMVVTYVIEATAAMIVFVTLAKSLLESLGYTKEDKFSKSIYLGVLWLICAAMAATPIGHPVTILMLNSLAAVETDVGVAAFTRLDLGAAVQTHSVSQAQALPAGTFDRDSALRLFQAERGPDSRRSCGGHR